MSRQWPHRGTGTARTHLVGGSENGRRRLTAAVEALEIRRFLDGLAVPDAGFEDPAVGAGNFAYNATGGAWAFAGDSGVSANDSDFTSGNPPAPEGAQVAFLQDGGSVASQSVAGWGSGSYVITLSAAQRERRCGLSLRRVGRAFCQRPGGRGLPLRLRGDVPGPDDGAIL